MPIGGSPGGGGAIVFVDTTSESTVTGSAASIDTSAIDGYRQGVELTQRKHFVAGTAKIWSGYADHQLPQETFGESVIWQQGTPFEEKLKYNTTSYLTASKSDKLLYENVHGDQLKRLREGALEPFGIRSGSLDEFGTQVHGIRGDRVDNIRDWYDSPVSSSYNQNIPPFADGKFLIALSWHLSGTIPVRAQIVPFDDLQLDVAAMPVSASVSFISARQQLSPDRTQLRIPYNKCSMGTGFTYGSSYGNHQYGVDSLAFGGLVFPVTASST